MSCLALLGILCASSLASSPASSFVTFPWLLGCNRSARFSFYIIDLDKQLYIELVTSWHRCLVSLIWRCNVYLAFCSLWPVCITYSSSTGPSTVSLIIAPSSCVTHSTGFTRASSFLKYHDIIFRNFLLQSGSMVLTNNAQAIWV